MKCNLIINPLFFFIFGFFYYLIVPYLTFIFIGDFSQYTPLEASLNYIDIDFFNIYYWLDLILILFSFYIGFKLSFKIKNINKTSKLDILVKKKIFFLFLVLFFSITIAFLVINFFLDGNMLFSGYKKFNIKFLGQISTLTFLTVFFLNYTDLKNFKIIFLFFLLLEFIILLSLGSRNIVVNGILAIALSGLYYNKYLIYNKYFYFSLFSCVVLILFIGLWRTGYEYKVGTFLGIFLSEPMFVLTSVVDYFDKIGRDIFNIPNEIFVSIINFIPTIIYPEKVNIINGLMGYKQSFSHFGASSILVSLYSNFGLFYFLYLLCIGYYFGFLYRKAYYSKFFRTVYFLSAPLLMFQFYNQYIYSMFKLLFWNGLIVPFIIISIFSKFKK